MSERSYECTWLPDDWMDECIPATLRHPTDFIHKCDDGTFIVIPKNGKDDLTPDGDEDEQEHLLFKVRDGDIVRFIPHENYGTYTLRVSDDLSCSVVGEYPSKANTFYLPDTETIADSIDGVIQQDVELTGPISPGEYDIDVYWWGDDVAFRFVVSTDGTAHFVEVGKVH